MAKVRDVFLLIRNGASIKQTEGASGLPITRIETISSRVVDRNKMGYADVVDNGEYDDYILQDGDILMSHINSEKHLGKTAIYENLDSEKIIHGMNLLVLRCDERLIPKYAYYFFNSNRFIHQIPNITKKSVNQASFNVSALKQLYIPVPDKEVQKDIISVLDKVDNLCDCYNKQLNDLELLIKSRFIEMFGDPNINPYHWPMVKNGFVIKSCESGWSGNGVQRARKSGEIAVLKVSAVTKGYFISDECKVLDNQEQIKKYVFPEKGDLLFSRANTREMVGATAIIYNDYPELILPDKLWKLKFIDIVNVVYMKHVLSCNHIRSQFSLISNGTSGSMYNVSMSKFKEIDIPLPPIDLQNKFADFVHQTEKSKFTHCYELLLLIIKKIWYNNYV